MENQDIASEAFRSGVARLFVPGMGTEVVAPLLANLVQLVRPRRVLEVGMGYTTPFLAAALATVERQVRAETQALARKTVPYLADTRDLDEQWLNTKPVMAAPGFYVEPYRPQFIAIDDLSIAESSAGRVREVLDELGLADRVRVLNSHLHDCISLFPPEFTPIDLAWVDAWECLYFFEHFWELINPDGGLVVMHYLATYPEGETILDYFAEIQRIQPDELEIVTLLESHKLMQNSLTVLRRTSELSRHRYADTQGRVRLGALRGDAEKVAGAHFTT